MVMTIVVHMGGMPPPALHTALAPPTAPALPHAPTLPAAPTTQEPSQQSKGKARMVTPSAPSVMVDPPTHSYSLQGVKRSADVAAAASSSQLMTSLSNLNAMLEDVEITPRKAETSAKALPHLQINDGSSPPPAQHGRIEVEPQIATGGVCMCSDTHISCMPHSLTSRTAVKRAKKQGAHSVYRK
jgi:hypothetical protein